MDPHVSSNIERAKPESHKHIYCIPETHKLKILLPWDTDTSSRHEGTFFKFSNNIPDLNIIRMLQTTRYYAGAPLPVDGKAFCKSRYSLAKHDSDVTIKNSCVAINDQSDIPKSTQEHISSSTASPSNSKSVQTDAVTEVGDVRTSSNQHVCLSTKDVIPRCRRRLTLDNAFTEADLDCVSKHGNSGASTKENLGVGSNMNLNNKQNAACGEVSKNGSKKYKPEKSPKHCGAKKGDSNDLGRDLLIKCIKINQRVFQNRDQSKTLKHGNQVVDINNCVEVERNKNTSKAVTLEENNKTNKDVVHNNNKNPVKRLKPTQLRKPDIKSNEINMEKFAKEKETKNAKKMVNPIHVKTKDSQIEENLKFVMINKNKKRNKVPKSLTNNKKGKQFELKSVITENKPLDMEPIDNVMLNEDVSSCNETKTIDSKISKHHSHTASAMDTRNYDSSEYNTSSASFNLTCPNSKLPKQQHKGDFNQKNSSSHQNKLRTSDAIPIKNDEQFCSRRYNGLFLKQTFEGPSSDGRNAGDKITARKFDNLAKQHTINEESCEGRFSKPSTVKSDGLRPYEHMKLLFESWTGIGTNMFDVFSKPVTKLKEQNNHANFSNDKSRGTDSHHGFGSFDSGIKDKNTHPSAPAYPWVSCEGDSNMSENHKHPPHPHRTQTKEGLLGENSGNENIVTETSNLQFLKKCWIRQTLKEKEYFEGKSCDGRSVLESNNRCDVPVSLVTKNQTLVSRQSTLGVPITKPSCDEVNKFPLTRPKSTHNQADNLEQNCHKNETDNMLSELPFFTAFRTGQDQNLGISRQKTGIWSMSNVNIWSSGVDVYGDPEEVISYPRDKNTIGTKLGRLNNNWGSHKKPRRPFQLKKR